PGPPDPPRARGSARPAPSGRALPPRLRSRSRLGLSGAGPRLPGGSRRARRPDPRAGPLPPGVRPGSNVLRQAAAMRRGLASALLLVGAACGGSEKPAAPRAPRRLGTVEIARLATPSVVTIRTERALGTGFVI